MISAPVMNDGTVVATGQPKQMAGDVAQGFLFCPSARVMGSLIGASDRIMAASEAERRKSKCIMKGYRETVELETNNNTCWMWRRIVFTTTGLKERFDQSQANQTVSYDISKGYTRPLWNIRNGNSEGAARLADIYNFVFDGTRSVDWANPFTAKVDRRQCRVYHDRTRTIQSTAGQKGRFWIHKEYYPVNKQIIYADDEDGAGFKNMATYSMGNPGSVGDLFVFDIFDNTSGQSSDTMNIGVGGTYYWTEP